MLIDQAQDTHKAEPANSAAITLPIRSCQATRLRGHGVCNCRPRILPPTQKEKIMRLFSGSREGKLGWILLWALGVPIPILLILFLVRGCT